MNSRYPDPPSQPDTNDLEAARKAIRDGANRMHAKAAFMKPTVLTDAESAAIARKKLDERSRP